MSDINIGNTQINESVIAAFTHEILNPIHSIILNSEQLLSTDLSEQERAERVLNVIATAKYLEFLAKDYLTLSRTDTSVKINMAAVDITSEIKKAIGHIPLLAKEKGLQFDVSIDQSIPVLFADHFRITQVILNLISNAIKFTSAGDVSLKVSQKVASSEIIYLSIEVSDTGIGISKEDQAKVFKKFQQANEQIANLYGGTGLGLYIVKEIISAMGGEIELISPNHQSEVNPGLTVKVILPVKMFNKESSESFINQNSSNELGSDLRVLMVEDDRVNQKLAKFMFKELAISADIAGSGEEALELAGKKHYDIIFIDVRLPGISGIDLASRIRDISRNVKLIGLTANVFKEEVEACIQSGMEEVIFKPYSKDQILRVINKYFNS